jgi:uncharacterized protein YuzE
MEPPSRNVLMSWTPVRGNLLGGGDVLPLYKKVRRRAKRRECARGTFPQSENHDGSCFQVETIRVSDELNVDLAPDGTVYGIELLNANAQLQAADEGALVVVNEALGERREISLMQ